MTQPRDVPTVDLAGKVTMPLVGFGTWQMRGREAYEAVRYALEVGYRHLDTATMYGNETEVGRALRDSGLRRDEVFVATKLLPSRAGHERETLTARSDEHTSELQSPVHIVCRLLLEKKKRIKRKKRKKKKRKKKRKKKKKEKKK